MFESALLEHRLDKDAFRKLEPQLRSDLLDAQFDLFDQKRHSLLVLINGPDGAGKGQVLNRLYEWLDARHLSTLAYGKLTEEERQHPLQWRFWRDMPPKGEIGLVIGSWYHDVMRARALGEVDRETFEAGLHRVNEFEAMLHAEGVRLLKLLLYIDPDMSWKRHRGRGSNGLGRPIVEEWGDIDTGKERRRLVEGALEAVRVTSTGPCLWDVVPATDPTYRDAAVGRLLLDALRRANAEPDPAAAPRQPAGGNGKGRPRRPAMAQAAGPGEPLQSVTRLPVTAGLDFGKAVPRDEYEKEIAKLRKRVWELSKAPDFARRGLVCVFEGNDAAGKGGAIRRVRACFDPRSFRVYPTAAPSDEERARPYLWRFWRHVPRRGHISIFDRSWYGRVLVERVEGFCREEDWRRAYDEINDFELTLSEAGLIVVKFWLAITQDEQLRRFKAREEVSFKRFKITPEDWRNRDKWPQYEEAVTDMVDRTSTTYAPWTLVAANDKHYARLKVLRTLAGRLEAALG